MSVKKQTTESAAEPGYPPLDMPQGVERKAVTIWRDGVALDGDIYRPAGLGADASVPGIVLCHGWGGSKLTAERYAALFAAAGMVALTFTQATWFGSGARLALAVAQPPLDDKGEAMARVRFVRALVDPADWSRNFEAAVDYLAGEPNLDAGRIGAWGTSFGGGTAIYAAANDRRIKALVVQVAMVSALKGEMLDHARRRAIDVARGTVAPFGLPGDTAPRMPGLANLARFARYDALGQLDRLDAPTLMIDAGDEELFSTADNCGRAHEILKAKPGQIVERHVIPGIDHYGIYFDGYDRGSRWARDWFVRHLADGAHR